MEDYKKKYEEALGRARTFSQRWQGIEATDSELALQELKEIFPELKESEDEKIKEKLLQWLKLKLSNPKVGFVYEEMKQWIAWLEKSKYTEEDLDNAYKCADEVQYRRGYEDAKREFEKQGEQKPAWSGKDSSCYDDICEILINLIYSPKSNVNKDAVQRDLNWIMSIKEKICPQNKQNCNNPIEINRRPLKENEVKVGDIITYFRDGKKGIMLVSSFDAGIYPRCKWGITHIDGTAYGDWAPGSGPYYYATEEEKQQLYNTMPEYVKDWLKSIKERMKGE